MMRILLILALATALPGAALAESERGKDELAIGLTQYPPTLNPGIDATSAKVYVLAMTRRPFTVYDATWNLVCMLCTTLPTIANGLAVPFDRPNGKRGIRLTYTIQPEARWGDGTPVTTAPAERHRQRRALSPHH